MQTETRRDRRGRGCPETHTNERGKTGPICLPFSEASAGYLYESESVAIQCTLHREREGKGKGEVQRIPAGDRVCGIVCEECPVFRLKTGSVLCVKVRQRARG